MDVIKSINQNMRKAISLLWCRRHSKSHIKIKEGQQRKSSDLRRLCAEEAERRYKRNLYCQKDLRESA